MYYLGIDGGGTKTTGVLSNANGTVLRTQKFGAGNISVLGKEKFTRLLNDIIYGLLGDETVDKIRWATFAFAGAGRAEEKETANKIISDIGLKDFNVLTDAELFYYSVHGEDQGLLVSSGTGSICIVKNEKNELEQLGGWGYLLGDEGSGFYIGRHAIRATIEMNELGKKPSQLTRDLISHYEINHPKELITKIYRSPNAQNIVASCARIVCEQALKNEPSAVKIVQSAADALFTLCLTGIDRLNTMPPYKIGLTGSVLDESSPVVREFKKQAKKKHIDFNYINQYIQPAAAGVLMSVRSSGERVSESLINKMWQVNIQPKLFRLNDP